MTTFTRRSLSFGLALVFIVLPAAVMAAGNGTHRIEFTEGNTVRTDEVASYGNIEEFANGQTFDQETIRFLERNMWLPESSGEFADLDVATDGQILDLETIRFLEDNIWDYGSVAEFAAGVSNALYPSLEEVIGLRAGELNY